MYEPIMQVSEAACLADWRREILSSLGGTIVEVGAGTGYNVPHYPGLAREITLTEPDPHMRQLLERKTGYAVFRSRGFQRAAAFSG
jgi:protein-L-isoaspartate O-methyltransferase